MGGSSEDKVFSPTRIGQGEIHPLKAALWGSNPYLYYTSWITAMQFILELASSSSNVSNWLNSNWSISPVALHHWLALHCRVNDKIILNA